MSDLDQSVEPDLRTRSPIQRRVVGVLGALTAFFAVNAYAVPYLWPTVYDWLTGPSGGSGTGGTAGDTTTRSITATEYAASGIAMPMAGMLFAVIAVGLMPSRNKLCDLGTVVEKLTFGRSWLVGRKGSRRGTGWLLFGAPFLLSMLGLACTSWFFTACGGGSTDTGDVSEALPLWSRLIWDLFYAALGEELLVVAFPVAMLMWWAPKVLRSPAGWIAVVSVLTAMRMVYHLYQGQAAAQHLFWAAGTAVLYLVFRRVWPLVLSHLVFDWLLLVTDDGYVSVRTEGTVFVLVGVVATIVGGYLLWHSRSAADVSAGDSTVTGAQI